MIPDIILVAITFICVAFFLPLPLFWLILHRNIAYFRRHHRHALGLKLGLLLAGAGIAWSARADLPAAVAFEPLIQTTGAVLLAASLYLTYRTAKLMGRDVLFGIAELRNRKKLITHDLFAYIRHPRYFTVFVFLAGLFLLTGGLAFAYLFFYSVIMFTLVAAEEEHECARRFGPAYRRYKKRTGGFVPRLRQGRR